MTPTPPSVQRSFRLASATAELLDRQAELVTESRNALADRLLAEGLRMERHPFITFRTGAAGRREAHVGISRLKVRQLIATLKGHHGNIPTTAEYFTIALPMAEAAASYYAEFSKDIDADIEWHDRWVAEEQSRWQREQAAFA